MEYQDYYKILGITRSATEREIKQAYRKLAQKYHPDHNPGDKNAEEKFKEINEANQVLSDPAKRTRYNQLGESYSSWQQGGAPANGFNWDDWFTTSPGRGTVRVENLDDLMGESFSEFFRRIFGGMPDLGNAPQERTRGRRVPYQRPIYEQPVEISLSEAYQGTTRRIELNDRRLEVKIPAGTRTGLKVRVANVFNEEQSGRNRDLYLVIQVSTDPNFERKGDDLHTNILVDLFTAVLGGEAMVSTLAGNVVLTIPEGTQPEQVFRLAGKGMPHLKNPAKYGDLYARVKVKKPHKLTAQQKELFKQLARS